MCICHWSARRWFDCAFQLNSFAGSPPPSPFMTQWWNRVHDKDEEKRAGSKPTLGNRSVNRVRLDSPRGCIWDHRGLGLALKTSTAFPQLVLMEGVWGIVPESLWGQSLPCVSPCHFILPVSSFQNGSHEEVELLIPVSSFQNGGHEEVFPPDIITLDSVLVGTMQVGSISWELNEMGEDLAKFELLPEC